MMKKNGEMKKWKNKGIGWFHHSGFLAVISRTQQQQHLKISKFWLSNFFKSLIPQQHNLELDKLCF